MFSPEKKEKEIMFSPEKIFNQITQMESLRYIYIFIININNKKINNVFN